MPVALHGDAPQRQEGMTAAPTYESLAGIVNHTLLEPELTNAQVVDGLEVAKRYGVATVTVRACDADLGVRMVQGSPVTAGSIVSYPFGFQSTAVKLYEARDLLRRGAKEIGVVVGASKLLSREFQQVQTELNQMVESCRGAAARLTVYLETSLLTDEQKIIACTCCERAEVDFVSTAGGYTVPDLKLLRKHLPDETGIQVSGVSTLGEALELQALGVSRIATASTVEILSEWKRRLTPPSAT
jgi:deoxyribose-phosphate aldolase